MTTGRLQAKHIPDEVMIEAIRDNYLDDGRWGKVTIAMGWDIHAKSFPDWPYKVVLAKLRQLHKRGMVTGCPCGCRGDWHVVGDESDGPKPKVEYMEFIVTPSSRITGKF